MKSAELQNQINILDEQIHNGQNEDGSRASDAQLNLMEMTRTEKRKELDTTLAEEASQQAHEVRMEEATQTIGYILDTMNVEGLTIAEIITNDDEYKLVRKGVQDAFISQAATYSQSISDLQASQTLELNSAIGRAIEAEGQLEQFKTDNNDLEVKNYQLGLENDELAEKVRKGAEALGEAVSQIDQQKKHIEDLQTQIAIGVRGALNVVSEPQDTSKIAAEIIARKVRITNVQFKDETGIDRRIKTAVEVLSGNEITYEAIYERRYIILNLEESAQYRAEIEQKKAEEEAQNAVIPTLDSPIIEPVTEVVEPVTEIPFQQENQVDSQNSGTNTQGEGNQTVEPVVGQPESEVITLESLKAEVDAIKSHLGLVA